MAAALAAAGAPGATAGSFLKAGDNVSEDEVFMTYNEVEKALRYKAEDSSDGTAVSVRDTRALLSLAGNVRSAE